MTEGERFVAIGTAREAFIKEALRLCEGLADDFLDHFPGRGFEVHPPPGRMSLVVLDNSDEFARFLGTGEAPDVTGIYEVGPNYLVLYDGRNGGPPGIRAERANSITLYHEATHQLTFNTGLLAREAEIPLAVSEGLATYGEVRRPDGRTRIGAVNRERLDVIADSLRRRLPLIPLADLVGDDGPFRREDTAQIAYAQSWLFVFGLMRNERASGRFRAYLEALRELNPPRPRIELAREHLGELEQLDESLRAFALRLVRGK